MERLLNIQKGFNFRDLGGYQTTDGHSIKWQRLIRSGSLAKLNEHDLDLLAQIPITLDMDLRAPGEIKTAPDKVPSTAQYYQLSVFETDETGASKGPEELANRLQIKGNGHKHMVEVYDEMPKAYSAKLAYQKMFGLLLNNQPNAAGLFHCTAGKDRTGFAAYLILSALHVPYETIKQDYLLSNQTMGDFINGWLKVLHEQGKDEVVIENTKALGSVSLDYLNSANDFIVKNYGSTENYLQQHLKLSSSDLRDFRKLYLD